jgi:hypothetical protein
LQRQARSFIFYIDNGAAQNLEAMKQRRIRNRGKEGRMRNKNLSFFVL